MKCLGKYTSTSNKMSIDKIWYAEATKKIRNGEQIIRIGIGKHPLENRIGHPKENQYSNQFNHISVPATQPTT